MTQLIDSHQGFSASQFSSWRPQTFRHSSRPNIDRHTTFGADFYDIPFFALRKNSVVEGGGRLLWFCQAGPLSNFGDVRTSWIGLVNTQITQKTTKLPPSTTPENTLNNYKESVES